ncbi:hypothetical protein BpHYR1_038813, partial [Brachionus plicatilis]
TIGKDKATSIDSIYLNKILSTDLRGISKSLDKYNQSNLKPYFFHYILMETIGRLLFLIYDQITNIVATLSKYISSLKGATDWKLHQNSSVPLQSGSIDCWVYVCQYAKYFGFNKIFDFNQNDIKDKRSEMANEIINFEIIQKSINV